HLPAALKSAHGAAEAARADTLLGQLTEQQERVRSYETQAAEAGDFRVALLALREGRATVALRARMTGRLEPPAPPPAPLVGILYTSLDPATGEAVVIDPMKEWPDPVPPPGQAKEPTGPNSSASDSD